jgi:hypothetical protein
MNKLDKLLKMLNTKFNENPCRRIPAVPCGQNDVTKLMVACTFRMHSIIPFVGLKQRAVLMNIWTRSLHGFSLGGAFYWGTNCCNTHRFPFFSSLTKRREIFAGTQLVRDPSGNLTSVVRSSRRRTSCVCYVVFIPTVSVFLCRCLCKGWKEHRIFF